MEVNQSLVERCAQRDEELRRLRVQNIGGGNGGDGTYGPSRSLEERMLAVENRTAKHKVAIASLFACVSMICMVMSRSEKK